MSGWYVGLEFVGDLNDMEHLNEAAEGAFIANYNSKSRVLSLSHRLDAVEYDDALQEAREWASKLPGVAKLVSEGVLFGPDRMVVETLAARARGWDLLGSAEVADVLGVSTARVRQLEQRPDFPQPAVTIAGGRIYRRDEIEEYAERRSRTPGRPAKAQPEA
ncbi:helix-turn-helix transcriptional regulator [Micromonospora sp. WMMD723]|uniref:helix-turn-helix transcriptional regulator n=1 Tax=Micromonospora sp. WMMD723 TaxID=3403465 RepID=UPI003CF859C1